MPNDVNTDKYHRYYSSVYSTAYNTADIYRDYIAAMEALEQKKAAKERFVLSPGVYAYKMDYLGYRPGQPVFIVLKEFSLRQGNWDDVKVFFADGTLVQVSVVGKTLVERAIEWHLNGRQKVYTIVTPLLKLEELL